MVQTTIQSTILLKKMVVAAADMPHVCLYTWFNQKSKGGLHATATYQQQHSLDVQYVQSKNRTTSTSTGIYTAAHDGGFSGFTLRTEAEHASGLL